MDWITVEYGEMIKKSSVIGVGKIRPVKVSSGKGQELVTRTIYNFTIRLGTGGIIIKSAEYSDESTATKERESLLK